MTLQDFSGEVMRSAWPFLANHVWQAAWFALVVLGLTRMLKNASARMRYAAWFFALLKFVVPTTLLAAAVEASGVLDWSIFRVTGPVAAPSGLVMWVQPVAEFNETVIVRAGFSSLQAAAVWTALGIWVVVCAALFLRWRAERKRFARLVATGRRTTFGREASALTQACGRLGPAAKVDLVLTDRISEPGVWGVARPVVVFPETLAAELSDTELEAVMLHELIHVVRRDNLIGCVQMAVRCLFWFHPLIWVVDRKLLAEREQVCDEKVVELTRNTEDYASGILKVFRFSLGRHELAGAAFAGGSSLHGRIEHIMLQEKLASPTSLRRVVVGSLLLLLAGLWIGTGFFNRRSSSVQAEPGRPFNVIPVNLDSSAQSPDLENAPAIPVRVVNLDGAPVVVQSVQVWGVTKQGMEKVHDSKTFIESEQLMNTHFFKVSATLANTTGKRVAFLLAELHNADNAWGVCVGGERSVEPFGVASLTIKPTVKNLASRANSSELVFQVREVRFEDGTQWGTPPPPPPVPPSPSSPPSPPSPPSTVAPPSPAPPPAPETAPTAAAPPSAPLPPTPPPAPRVLKKVQAEYPPLAKAARASGDVTVEMTVNETGDVESARAVSGHPLLQPAALTAARQWKFEPLAAKGKPARFVTLTTFKFELPDKDDEASVVRADPTAIRRSEGFIRGNAVHRAVPEYPEEAKAAGASGDVVVEITISENGDVIRTRIVSGDPVFYQAVLDAARKWKFNPAVLQGKPVKVSGILTFRFML